MIKTTIQDVINEHNRVRRQHWLKPLKHNDRLARAAQLHAERMQAVGNIWHGNYKGRIANAGYRFSSAGENVAMTPGNPMDLWMNSRGHRRNILRDWKDFGIGYSSDYWCAVFANPK